MSLSFSVTNEEQLFEITNQLAPTLKNQQVIFIEGDVGDIIKISNIESSDGVSIEYWSIEYGVLSIEY